MNKPTHHSRRFIARHLTLWLALIILGAAVVLSAVLTGSRDKSRQSAAETVRVPGAGSRVAGANRVAWPEIQPTTRAEKKRTATSLAGGLNEGVGVGPIASGGSDISAN